MQPTTASRNAGHRTIRREAAVLLAALVVVAATYVTTQARTGSPAVPDVRRPAIAVPGGQAPAAADDGSALPLADQIAFWARRVDEQPSDFLSLTQLAVAHAEHARLTFDIAGYERAAAAIERALAISPENPATIRARATIRFATHAFQGAVADAERVLARLPDDAAALAVLGDAQLELGRIEAATATYGRLAAVTGGPALDVRLARVAWLTGDGSRSVLLARRALAEAPGEPAARAFYAYAVGEYARRNGDAVAARAAFELALELRPDDVPALVGLARIDAWEGRTEAALARLDAAAAIAPQPETLALTADLHRRSGDTTGAERAEATVRLSAELADPSGALFDRQLLLFELDHGGATPALLTAARDALAGRPDAAGHDLVGWAAYRLGHLDLAGAESAAALATGSRDARLLYHAGAIAIAAGDVARGVELLDGALALGPALDPAELAEVRALLEAQPR